jgi:hypothetical protein
MGRRPIVGIAYIQTSSHFYNFLPGPGPIQTGAPSQIRAADRPSGTPAVLPSRYVASVDHMGLLRRPARCSVITQRARMQQRPSSETASVSACVCGLVLCGSSAGQSRRKICLPPSPFRQRATWLSACRRREKRPSSSTRQANKVGGVSRRAPRI